MQPGGTTLLTVAVTPGANPPSTGISVSADLTAIGGSATQAFHDDGLNGDATAGDNVFSYQATVSAGTTTGSKTLPASILDAQARSGSASISLKVFQALAIHDIQGPGDSSPYAGAVVQTTGIVTGVKTNGFFIQTPFPDADPNTSEGVFVFTSSAPHGCPSAIPSRSPERCRSSSRRPTRTARRRPRSPEVPSVTVISTGNPLPDAITLTAANTDPTGPIDQLEKYEGMRVHVDSLTVVAPTQGTISEANATSVSNGVFYGVITGIARPFRERGIEVPDPTPAGVPSFDANPERLRVDSDGLVGGSAINVSTGAVVTNLTGPLDYAFRAYTIDPDPTTAPGVSGGISAAIPVPAPAADQFTVAAFNLERFFDTVNDPSVDDVALTATAFNNRLNKASLAIRNVLRTPDILAVEEMENLPTLQTLATKINNDAVAALQPNPNYQAYLVEGNDIGGIDVGFLVKSARVNVIDVTQYGKDTTYTNPNNNQQELLNDRPPLVLRATVNAPAGAPFPVTVIVNHLRSFSGVDDPVDGTAGPRQARGPGRIPRQPDPVAPGGGSQRAHRLGRRLQRVRVFRRLRGHDRGDHRRSRPVQRGRPLLRGPRQSEPDRARRHGDPAGAVFLLLRRQRPGPRPRAHHAEPLLALRGADLRAQRRGLRRDVPQRPQPPRAHLRPRSRRSLTSACRFSRPSPRRTSGSA